ELLERHHALVRRELTRYRGEERDTAGDGFFATFDGPARAIRCAQAVVAGIHELGLEVRAGVHTGDCEVHEDKVTGLAVVIGSRGWGGSGASGATSSSLRRSRMSRWAAARRSASRAGTSGGWRRWSPDGRSRSQGRRWTASAARRCRRTSTRLRRSGRASLTW